ncbi:hypothetical protein CL617_02320 [archaeon]|nr:hypothetical protein [archaeon]|tara:strand:+ start:9909 stop:10802 length:894 start_codon:yes stop_codon:yes gene_type:complete
MENLTEKLNRLASERQELEEGVNTNWQNTLPEYVETLRSYVSSLTVNTDRSVQNHGINLEKETKKSMEKHSQLIDVLSTYAPKQTSDTETKESKLAALAEATDEDLETIKRSPVMDITITYEGTINRIKEEAEQFRERGYATSTELIPLLGLDTKNNRSQRAVYAQAIKNLNDIGYFVSITKDANGSTYFLAANEEQLDVDAIKTDIAAGLPNDDITKKHGITDYSIRAYKAQITRKNKRQEMIAKSKLDNKAIREDIESGLPNDELKEKYPDLKEPSIRAFRAQITRSKKKLETKE